MARRGFGALLFGLVAVSGCSSADVSGARMDAGATPGGSQDVGYFRAQLQAGQIPQAEDITLEGFISEHDIPSPAGCAQALCLAGAVAHTPSVSNGGAATFIHLAMGTNVDIDNRPRTPMNLAVVVDVSGSMTGDNRLEWVKAGLLLMLDELGPEDRLALVTYSSEAQVVVSSRLVEDAAVFSEAIRALRPSGSTNLNAGMILGYEQVAAHASSGSVDRVMLLSDGMVNTGVTVDADILANSATYNDEGIGVTTIGVGLDFNHELMRGLSEQGGGNFYFIESANKLQTVFVDELDTVLVPLASDLEIRIALGERFALVDVFGLRYEHDVDGTMVVRVPTVFASRRGGAILIQVEATEALGTLADEVVSQMSYRYRPFDTLGNLLDEVESLSTTTVPTLFTDSRGDDVAYQTPAARKTAVLWNIVNTFQRVSNLVHVEYDHTTALRAIQDLAEHVDSEAEALDDDELRRDRTELINRYAINLGGWIGEPSEFESPCAGDPAMGGCMMGDDMMYDEGYYMGCAATRSSWSAVFTLLALLGVLVLRRRK